MNYSLLIIQNLHNPMIAKNNPYGYRLNVNHPLIREIYWRYKEKNNIPRRYPLSDNERYEFEKVTIAWLIKKNYLVYDEESIQINLIPEDLRLKT